MERKRLETDVLDRKILEPDPAMVKSLGAHHTLETAIADLVDNSIDAQASEVIVRFTIERKVPTGLLVVDNGQGMTDFQIDEAMRIGRRRQYSVESHGHFGIGLKSASFSQADTLTVWSKPKFGHTVGRRLRKKDVQRDYSCEVLDPTSFDVPLSGMLSLVNTDVGTVVSWQDTTFPKPDSWSETENWLEQAKTSVRMHLGLIYHRLLSDGRIQITLDVFDTSARKAGPPENVVAIDPISFPATGVAGYPKRLRTRVDDVDVQIDCHIVPPKSSGPQFRLYGKDGQEHQGFYIYRNDRLLQAGGWNGVLTRTQNRALARVSIDDFDKLAPYLRMNPEKHGIAFNHELSAAIRRAQESATPDSALVTFSSYIECAESVLVESRRRRRTRRPIVEPAKGFHEIIRRTIRAEIPIRTDEPPVDIRWTKMPEGKLFNLDRDARTIYLNQRYREMLTGGKTGLSDAPLIKTLVFLLTEQHFIGQYWGSKDRDLLDMWDSVLGAAVRLELEYRNSGRSMG